KLHLAGTDFSDRRAGIYTLEHIARRLATFARSGDPKLAQAVPLLHEELTRLPHERAAGLPEGVIHQDLFRDNVLWNGDDSIAALIDFEQAGWGRLAYDRSVGLLAWCFQDDAFDSTLVEALVVAYQAVRRHDEAYRA